MRPPGIQESASAGTAPQVLFTLALIMLRDTQALDGCHGL